MADRSIHPSTPAEVAKLDQRHAQVSAIVDRLTQTHPTHQQPALAWLDMAEALFTEAGRSAIDYDAFVVGIAAEALRRAQTQGHEATHGV